MSKPTKTSQSIKKACVGLQKALDDFEKAMDGGDRNPNLEIQKELKEQFQEIKKKMSYFS